MGSGRIIKPLPPLKRSSLRQFPVKEFNRLVREVYQSAAHGPPPPREGTEQFINNVPFLARIVTGTDLNELLPGEKRAYGWVFAYATEDGKRYDDLLAGGGSIDDSMAYEEDDNPHVPIDGSAIVWMRAGEGGNYYKFSYKERAYWARINGSVGDAYGFVELFPDAGALWEDMPGGYTGTPTVNPLYEIHGVVGVPDGTYVRIKRGYCSGAPQIIVTITDFGSDETSPVQTISILRAVGGTYTLFYGGLETGNIAYDADAATVEAALEALALGDPVALSVTGTGTDVDPFVVTWDEFFELTLPLEATIENLKSDQEWVFTFPAASTSYDPVDGGTISTSQNNYQLTGVVTFFNIDTAISFTGFVAPGGGKSEVVYIKNIGSKVATFVHESGSSTAANRFHCPTQSDYQLPPQSIGVFKYDTIGLRWQPVLNIPTYAAYTKTQITSDQNDYALSEYAHIYRVSTDASRTVTGFADGFPGRLLILENVGSYDLVVANQSASSTAANRVITSTGADLTLGADQGAFLVYDGTTARWRVIAHTATVGITSLNGLTAATQTFAVGTAGTDFAVSSSGDTHTFDLPSASQTTYGKMTPTSQYLGGVKSFVAGTDTYGGIITGGGFGNSLGQGVTPSVVGNSGCIELAAPAAGYSAGHTYCLVFSNTLGATYTGSDTRSHCRIVADVSSSTDASPSPPSAALYASITVEATYWSSGGTSTATWFTVYNSASEGYGLLTAGTTMDAVYAVSHGGTTYKGATSVVSGLTFKGGLYISGSVSSSVSIGDSVGSGTANYILFVDGSGNLAQSADFQWDDTAKSLTLGNQGYLITTKTSAPSGIPSDSIAGPVFGS